MNTKTRSDYGSNPQSETQQDFRAKRTVPSTRRRIQGSLLIDRRGATLVELALVLPLLMLILLGCLDFGRILYVSAVVTNTAHEGAAWGSLNPPTSGGWNQGVVSAAITESAGTLPSLTDADITVADIPSGDPSAPGYVSVEVQTEYHMTYPGIFAYWNVPTTVIVTRRVVMPHHR